MPGIRKPGPIEPRFWAKVLVGSPNECWPWLASNGFRNYGKFKIGGTYRAAHIIAYELANNRLVDYKKGEIIMHSCDNPKCCNPAHLILGTQSDNIRDRELRKRNDPALNGHPRFHEGEIWLMRKLCIILGFHAISGHKKYKIPAHTVAKMFETNTTTIFRIWNSSTTQCIGGKYV